MERYRVFDHTADLGMEIYGRTAGDLFSNAAFAVFDIITDLSQIRPRETRDIVVEGSGWEDLLVNFLREVLYLFNGDSFLSKECFVSEIDEVRVVGKVSGERFDPFRHRIHKEIKAVTYHQVMVRHTPELWTGKVIFDV
jgi:SHS2 domain-containing protein